VTPSEPVQVLVLGPVRVRRGTEEVLPGGPRERAVLAAVAMAGERGLDHDRLVDHLWGSNAPRTAHRTAQAYVSRLRGLIGQEAIVTVAGRHRLTGTRVDLWEFERLVADARRVPARAPQLLRQALDLWRDASVAQDAALDGAADLLQAYERMRLDARELLLAHLDDNTVVRAAEELLAEAPHRERTWAALATAYYRLGRQDEALATIRAARRRLADDLGIDLSSQLETLERDLLHHRVAPAEVPALPQPVTPLVGRDDLVDDIVGALDRSRLVTLVGTGGIGKTRLALAVAERLRADASLPVFFAGLASVTSPSAVHDALGEAVDAGGSELHEAFERRFGRVAGLLVLDNCEHVLPTVANRVGSLLQRPWRLRILATSRAPLGVTGEVVVDVPPLDTADAGDGMTSPALRLFLERAADVIDVHAWGDRETEAAATLCRSLDGIPLALELAARRLRTAEVTELTEVATAEQADASPAGEPRHRTLAAALEWSYRDLPDEQRRAFRRLGLLHGRLPLASAATLVDDRGAVEGLLRASLLTRSAQGVGMYEPVRQYAVSLLDPAERCAGLAAVAEELVAFTTRAEEHLPGTDEVAWLDRVDAVHGDIRAVLEWAMANDREDLVPLLVANVGYLWLLGWSPREGRTWLSTALDLVEDRALRVRLLTWSSLVAVRSGDLDEARRTGAEAVRIARPLDDPRLLGSALHALAMPDKYGDRTETARGHLREAHPPSPPGR